MTDEPLGRPTDADRRIGRRITFFREEAGLTRVELAEQVGTTEDEVEAWETAKVVTSVSDLIKLCRALDIEPNDLLKSKLQ
jgi:transcriptional regulator with XRE-family HTH domain